MRYVVAAVACGVLALFYGLAQKLMPPGNIVLPAVTGAIFVAAVIATWKWITRPTSKL